MDSPAGYMVSRIEEAPRWSATPPVFQVPNVNGQNYSNGNYHEWGAKPFNEPRRRNQRGKNHQNRRNHQQAAWGGDHGPAPSAWQPPSPASAPAAPASAGGFQEPEGPVAVNVQGLPCALCRQNCLEAMLDQAGLADDVMGCSLGEETGNAVIYLASYDAAMKTVAHFGGRRWAHAGPPVMASVAEGQGAPSAAPPKTPPSRPAPSPPIAGARRARGASGQEPWSPMGGGAASPMQAVQSPGSFALLSPLVEPLPMPAFQGNQDYFKGNAFAMPECGRGELSPNSKARWADFADEDDDTHGSVENESTSAGSTGRATGDVAGEGENPFACDTDDGF